MRIVRVLLGCLAFLIGAAGAYAAATPAEAKGAASKDDPKPALAALDAIAKEEWLSQPSGLLLTRVIEASSKESLDAAAKSDTRAQALVGSGYLQLTPHYPQSDAEAEKFLKLAAIDNPIAQNNLGNMFLNGRTQEKKPMPAVAATYFVLAANQGHPIAQMNLGILYRDGVDGFPQHLKEAERLFGLAAKSGNADALYNYADIEARLYGEQADAFDYIMNRYTAALEAYKRDAAKGSPNAMRRVGEMIYNGEAPARFKLEEGFGYFKQASLAGDLSARFQVADSYDRGRGVAQDYAKAADLYRGLVTNGYAPAFTNLGFLYENGHGVAADKTEAIRLYKLGAGKGDARATEHLKRLGETP